MDWDSLLMGTQELANFVISPCGIVSQAFSGETRYQNL